MSNREKATALLDKVPEDKMEQVIYFLMGFTLADEIPNEQTLSAMLELEQGGGEVYTGSTHDIFATILAEAEC